MTFKYKLVKECFGGERQVFSIAPHATTLSALEILAANDIGALIVLDGDTLVGIVSERDYARKVELCGRNAAATTVGEIMTSEVVTVTPGQSIDECLRLMKQHRVGHLPVVEGGRVVNVLSVRDIMAEAITEEERAIRDLEQDRMSIINPDPSSY
jgi:CBS domain-containing protein